MAPELPPEDDAVVRATQNWLERAVIGLRLCPFAKAVHANQQIRYFVSHAESREALLADLGRELLALSDADPEELDTTLLIVPKMLSDFLDYNDFLELAEGVLAELDLDGTLQIASFHPDYRFGEHDADDPANCTNRSPYPILHLLREDSVARAVEAFPDAAQIFERNIETLRALGHAGFMRTLSGEAAPTNDTGLGRLGISATLANVAAELGFERPTAIQEASIPPLLAGKDLIGQSKTGSGKTAAFLLPILERLNLGTRELQALVLCPTRELGAQVARELRKLGRGHPGLSVAVLSGGEAVRDQARALERGVHVAVGTPGRVLDHLRRRTLRVHRVSTIVLDEADRMLDMGFRPDIERILKALPAARQTVFFSATFPDSFRELSEQHQREPVRVGDQSTDQRPDIRELVVRTEPSNKLACLEWVLDRHPHESALVFANFKVSVAQIEEALRRAGHGVASLHGDLEQRERDSVMAKFRNGSTRVLVATDVAARGIDLQQLDLVVNFDLPNQPEIYVHRIGRTGRAGNSGLAIALCTPADEPQLEAIQAFTGTQLLELKSGTRSARAPARAAGPSSRRDAPMVTLRLLGGRKDKLRPGDILGALTGEAGGLDGDDIGKIEIHERFSFVAIKRAQSEGALKSLRAGRIKGKRFRVERVD